MLAEAERSREKKCWCDLPLGILSGLQAEHRCPGLLGLSLAPYIWCVFHGTEQWQAAGMDSPRPVCIEWHQVGPDLTCAILLRA